MGPQEILQQYFGYTSFRKGQKEIIDAIMKGRDVLAVMPTGAGKSICYQVPALMMKGITIVISPLISLMQDQVKALAEAGVRAAYINSSLTERQVGTAFRLAKEGAFKIIYIAPERLETSRFLDFALSADISMVTVDEAHCISQWGQDFRPSYLNVTAFVEKLAKRPIVSAFTATATKNVKSDIRKLLELNKPMELTTGFDRENLSYWVESKGGSGKDQYILGYIAAHMEDSGIIYCSTRKAVEKLCKLLESRYLPVTMYHAGMDNESRKENQEDFVFDRKSIMVATNAFGMGIDKSNVRYVIHYNMPSCMENYYQEAGRAGRDGLASECILLYSGQDVILQKFFLEKKEYIGVPEGEISQIQAKDKQRLHAMIDYCNTKRCLRNYILNYFGEKAPKKCISCGSCNKKKPAMGKPNFIKQHMAAVKKAQAEQAVQPAEPVFEPKKKKSNALPWENLPNNNLFAPPVLTDAPPVFTDVPPPEEDDYYYFAEPYQEPLGAGYHEVLETNCINTYEEAEPEPEPVPVKSINDELFEVLRALRYSISKESNIPPYVIFSDKTLHDMSSRIPKNEEEFLKVDGVGNKKLERYGERFIAEIRKFTEEHDNNSSRDEAERYRQQGKIEAIKQLLDAGIVDMRTLWSSGLYTQEELNKF